MKKYKEKYKTGMIFRSEKYPWTDLVIDFVSYTRGSETAYTFNMNSIIDWVRINEEAFNKHISVVKGIDYNKVKNHEVSTFPYPFFGEMHQKSMDNYIRKYEMEFCGMSDKEVIVFNDDVFEYSSGFKFNVWLGGETYKKTCPIEIERLQTLPDGYTEFGLNEDGSIVKMPKTRRFEAIGNGWTVDMIAWIFSFMKKNKI